MSFILDALRKSESERQRDATPSLSQIPTAAPRSGLPPWAWAVIVVLGLSVFVLAAAWWRSTLDAPELEAANRGEGNVARGTLPAADEPATRPAASAASPAQAPELASPLILGTSGRPADANGRSLPTLADVVAEGMALPELELQLLSYSEDSAERFVFINGFQYRQGQRVQNGPLILNIYSEGVVLRHQGRDFVLLPD